MIWTRTPMFHPWAGPGAAITPGVTLWGGTGTSCPRAVCLSVCLSAPPPHMAQLHGTAGSGRVSLRQPGICLYSKPELLRSGWLCPAVGLSQLSGPSPVASWNHLPWHLPPSSLLAIFKVSVGNIDEGKTCSVLRKVQQTILLTYNDRMKCKVSMCTI